MSGCLIKSGFLKTSDRNRYREAVVSFLMFLEQVCQGVDSKMTTSVRFFVSHDVLAHKDSPGGWSCARVSDLECLGLYMY